MTKNLVRKATDFDFCPERLCIATNQKSMSLVSLVLVVASFSFQLYYYYVYNKNYWNSLYLSWCLTYLES